MKRIAFASASLFFVALTACSSPGPGIETFIDSAPDAYTNSTEATFAFSSDPAGAAFQCSFDDGSFEDCASPLTVEGLRSGSHRFAVRAIIDEQVDPTPATAEWIVDLHPPRTRITGGPGARSRETVAVFTLEADEEEVLFECSLDGGAFASCPASATVHGLTDGTHLFVARATDRAGNVDPEGASYEWLVDTQAPSTTIYEPRDPGPAVAIRFEADEPDCTFACALDRGAFAPCSSPMRLEGLTPGEHVFSVQATDVVGNTEEPPAQITFVSREPGEVTVRIAAANLTSGNLPKYEGPGIRILQGLRPDIVLIQEFNYETNTPTDLRAFVDTTFGPEFEYYREPTGSIPNGVISRYPILESGSWPDPLVGNRNFAWARIDVPGPIDLWVVSVHFLTSSAGDRNSEAQEVVAYIEEYVPNEDFLVVGGDFNTRSFTESAIGTLSSVVDTSAARPVDQNGNPYTNASRNEPYDWVLVDDDLRPLQVDTVIGSSRYRDGLIFDSRVYTPLSEVAPVEREDSGAYQMQHMLVVKDFLISE